MTYVTIEDLRRLQEAITDAAHSPDDPHDQRIEGHTWRQAIEIRNELIFKLWRQTGDDLLAEHVISGDDTRAGKEIVRRSILEHITRSISTYAQTAF